ncbi:MAG: L-seryl-tRNA(Sec) selenium transferase [Bradymonadia bacterium]
MTDPRARLPKVDALLRADLVARYGQRRVKRHARAIIDQYRNLIAAGGDVVLADIEPRLRAELANNVRTVINGTGVLLHTNLGRAPWSPAARAAAQDAQGYCDVEFDLEIGARGKRGAAVEDRICALMNAPAALVVNNCAGAVMLMLSALANDREVLVSRGELVEIGGGFRVPDVMQAAGAKLKEVGTTNKTHLRDFEAALTEDVAGILRVHHSNFKQIGFVHQPSLAELASLPTRLLVDLGSGQLDFNGAEPSVEEAMAAGAHVVCMSGDKLLGGPQAGIVIGQPEEIGCLRRHPIYRALRPDKTILAALEGTLDDWLTGRGTAVDHMRSLSVETMQAVVERWCSALNHRADLSVAQTRATVGGGSLPGEDFPSIALALTHERAKELQTSLLNGYPPVVCRRRDSQLFIDARSIIVLEQETLLLEALDRALTTL